MPACRLDFGEGFFGFFGVARHDDDLGTSHRHFDGGGFANAGCAAGYNDNFAFYFAAQGAINKQIRVQMAFPVIPQPPCVGIKLGHRNGSTFQRFCGFTIIKFCRIADEAEHIFGDPQILQYLVARFANRRDRHQALHHIAG